MKKLLIATMISLFVVGITASSYAAESKLHTSVNATVISFAAFSLIDDAEHYRSTDTLTFKTVDWTSLSGWYYNELAGLDSTTGDPNDGKSDVGLGVKSNVPFTIKISKISDPLNGKIGYYVGEAYNWDGTDSVSVVTVYPGSGFAGTEASANWGEIPTTSTLIYSSGTESYPDFSMGVCFALVPGDLAVGSYTTIVTYTMTTTM